MSSPRGLVIEPLERSHNRTAFDCGIESLDRYLKRQAGQDIRRRVSRVFVGRAQEDDIKVLGFYTLSALAIDLSVLPVALAAKLPRQPVPAALIGRLAVDRSAQGTGIGRMLLADAIKRTLAVSDEIAIYAVVVDAINERAESFYRRYGFARLAHGGSRLFLPLRSI
jgi:GNAT superfamily N-acetyltransferase